MKPTSEHSFPDALVMAWRLSEQQLEVEMSEVYFEGRLHGPARIFFPLLRPATAMSYDHSSDHWSHEEKIGPLKDICEFCHRCDGHYSLKGFSAESGKWTAVGIRSTEAQITW